LTGTDSVHALPGRINNETDWTTNLQAVLSMTGSMGTSAGKRVLDFYQKVNAKDKEPAVLQFAAAAPGNSK
jgi:hypothetical protein